MIFFRPINRVKKRTFVVLGITLLVTLLIAGLLAWIIAVLPGPDELVRLEITDEENRTEVRGNGINLDEVDTNNLITDGSFEPLVFRQALTVYDGDQSTLTVSSEDASAGLYGDSFFNGATARVLTQTDIGLQLKKTARVTAYGINRVGVFQSVKLPADLPAGRRITGFARRELESLAIGEHGLIIRDVASQAPALAVSGLQSDLSGICASSAGYLVCSLAGDLIYSTDGQFWSAWPVLDPKPLNGVAVADKDLYVAVGDDGTILTGPGGQMTPAVSGTAASLTDVVFGNGQFIAVGRGGTVLGSANGTIWQNVAPADISGDWLAADYKDGRFTIVGSHGLAAISDDGLNFRRLATNQSNDYLDVVMLTGQQLILLGRDGSFEVSNDSGQTWLQSEIATGMTSQIIALAGKDKILSADGSGAIGLAQLVAEIMLDSPLSEGVYQPGDFLFLETTTTAIPDAYLAASSDQPAYQDRWDLFGPGLAVRSMDDKPDGGGQASLHVTTLSSGQAAQAASQKTADAAATAAGQPAMIVSQALSATLFQANPDNDIYRLELWMRQEGLADRSVMAWLSGDFTAVGTTFTNVGSGWKKYTYTFVVPSQARKRGTETRLNIGYTGSGELWLDRVYLGIAGHSSDELSIHLTDMLTEVQPGALRMGFLPIGQIQAAAFNWAQLPGNETPSLQNNSWQCVSGGSLAAALQLARRSQSDPWLVIGSHISESELLSLLEYIAGPISEPYGKLRMNQGSISPWTDQFTRIYLEFGDNSRLFQSDQLRADFVDLMIRTIGESPYYRQIKNQLVFVDGMAYSDGVILSSADYHASDISGLASANPLQTLNDTFIAFYDQLPRNPEKPRQGWSELVRGATLASSAGFEPSIAELVELQLRDLGVNSSLVNLTLISPHHAAWRSQDSQAARVTAGIRDSTVLTVQPLTAGSEPTAHPTTVNPSGNTTGPVDQMLTAYAYRSATNLTIILANIGPETITCQLVTDLAIRGADLAKFDRSGQELSRKTLRRTSEKLTVLPGGVVFIQKALDTNQ